MRILFGTREDIAERNPYITTLVNGLQSSGTTVNYWSWKRAIMGDYDTIHHHWPEALIRGGSIPRRIIKLSMFVVGTAVARIRRKHIVQTVHNLNPHEGLNMAEKWVLRFHYRSVDSFIYLNSDGARHVYDSHIPRIEIPHPNYLIEESALTPTIPQPNMVTCVGFLRPYKGLEQIIDVFQRSPSLDIVIAGKPWDESYGNELELKVQHSSNIQLITKFLSENEIAKIVQSSSLVAIPYAQYNSGVLFLALSLCRPVLVPDTPGNRLLQKEFGRTWINLFEGDISTLKLQQQLSKKIDWEHQSKPDWGLRTWTISTERHNDLYCSKYESRR